MKKLLIVLALLLFLGGCSGVIMNAEYTKLLDQTVALSEMSAQLAEQGKMAEAEQVKALRGNANLWKRFQDARDGVKGDE